MCVHIGRCHVHTFFRSPVHLRIKSRYAAVAKKPKAWHHSFRSSRFRLVALASAVLHPFALRQVRILLHRLRLYAQLPLIVCVRIVRVQQRDHLAHPLRSVRRPGPLPGDHRA